MELMFTGAILVVIGMLLGASALLFIAASKNKDEEFDG